MKGQDYHISITVDATPQQAFEAITDITGWWTEDMQGQSAKEADEFSVRFADVHYSKQKLTEVIPGKLVVWLITDSNLSFIKDRQEWTNTRVRFDITPAGDKTRIDFTHVGLLPGVECFDACSSAWGQYIRGSLKQRIETGKGEPTPAGNSTAINE